MNKQEELNLQHWDEIAPVHLKSYGIGGLLRGISRIDEIQKHELYPIRGKSLIHLQCHIGTDSLSLALDGATVTAVDFSPNSIQIARDLSFQMQLPVRFITANVLDLQSLVSEKFDIVYTSKGVLAWISDIDKWAQTIAYLLKADGVFYILERHPILSMLDDTVRGEPRIKFSYFHQRSPIHFDDDQPDYSDSSYVPKNKTYEWTWTLSDIVNSLIRHGLCIELLNEHDKLFYPGFPGMAQTDDGWYYIDELQGIIPMTFSLRARKRE